MPITSPLPRSFFDRPTIEVANELLGCRLHRRVGGAHLVAEVVETEAYVGPEDLACHASKGRTPRTEVLFGPPGLAYVYFIYGLHWLLNAVTEQEGHGSAVLIRAVAPIEGLPEGSRLDGPARLTAALQVDGKQNRHDLTAGVALWFSERTAEPGPVEAGPRIGVDYAGEWADRPWRFWVRNSPHVSRRPARGPSRASRVVEGRPGRGAGAKRR